MQYALKHKSYALINLKICFAHSVKLIVEEKNYVTVAH